MADVCLYLIRLAEVCSVNLPEAILDKISKNSVKYPAHVVAGSANKYTEYDQPPT